MAPKAEFELHTGEKGASIPILQRLADEDTVPWYKKKNLRWLYIMLLPTCMGIEITSGFDSQLINALQIVDSWQKYFGQPKSHWLGFINASYSLGAILSLPFIPVINDYFGRRKTILIGSCIMIAGAIIQTFAQNVGNYIFARCVLGFGIPMCIVAGSALIGELAYPKERPIMTSLFNVAYFIGQITAACVCFGTNSIIGEWGWRTPSVLQALPSLLQVTFVLFLPESPRWLVSKDRVEEAHEILIKYHAEGDRDSDFVKAEMAQIQATISLEIESSKKSWLDIVNTAGMRRRLLVTAFLGLFTQFSGNTLISYYLNSILAMIGWTDSNDKAKLNIGLACWGGICAFTCALLVTKYRRRVMYLTCTCSLLLVYISWTISMERAMTAKAEGVENKAATIAVLFFIFMYGPCYNIGYNALTYTYLVELWPFAERSRGISIFQLFGRCATFLTTFLNPIGMDNIGWKWFIIYCCWLAFEIVFVWFLFPETFGRTLEELAFIFEDKAKSDAVVKAVEKARGGGYAEPSGIEKGPETTIVEDADDHSRTPKVV